MDPQLRSRFNADFMSDKYNALVRCVNDSEKWPADFRISETPIFLTREFTEEVTRAANEIVAATRTPEFVRHSAVAVPKDFEVPNESAHPSFHVVDFAICAEGDRLVPRLIELQAFPSLFGFQLMLLDCFRKGTRSFHAIGPPHSVESKITRISNCCGAPSSQIHRWRVWCRSISSRKNKKPAWILPLPKPFSGCGRFA